ncbi:hypothetical protein Dimus_030744 [Dionaea muscipula]
MASERVMVSVLGFDDDGPGHGEIGTNHYGYRAEGIVCRGLRAGWGSTIDEWARDCLFNSWELRLIATGRWARITSAGVWVLGFGNSGMDTHIMSD